MPELLEQFPVAASPPGALYEAIANEPALLEVLAAEPLTDADFECATEDIAEAEPEERKIKRLHDRWDAARAGVTNNY